MLASLALAAFAVRQQQRHVRNLQRLARLERRVSVAESTLNVLSGLGAGRSILQPAWRSVVDDLSGIRKLDPRRVDLEKAIASAETNARKNAADKADQAAVASESELMRVRARLGEAMQLFERLRKSGRIKHAEFQQAKADLREIALTVGVNSFQLMASHALKAGNTMKALTYYRKAESILQSSGLPPDEREQRLQAIASEKRRLIGLQGEEKGLLPLASGD